MCSGDSAVTADTVSCTSARVPTVLLYTRYGSTAQYMSCWGRSGGDWGLFSCSFLQSRVLYADSVFVKAREKRRSVCVSSVSTVFLPCV